MWKLLKFMYYLVNTVGFLAYVTSVNSAIPSTGGAAEPPFIVTIATVVAEEALDQEASPHWNVIYSSGSQTLPSTWRFNLKMNI